MKLRIIFLLSTLLILIAQVNVSSACSVGLYEPRVPDCLR